MDHHLPTLIHFTLKQSHAIPTYPQSLHRLPLAARFRNRFQPSKQWGWPDESWPLYVMLTQITQPETIMSFGRYRYRIEVQHLGRDKTVYYWIREVAIASFSSRTGIIEEHAGRFAMAESALAGIKKFLTENYGFNLVEASIAVPDTLTLMEGLADPLVIAPDGKSFLLPEAP